MQFLQELNESRLYKRLGQVDGQSVHDIAERLFEHLLALQILVHEDPAYAKALASQILKQQQFNGFRTSQSDLYNLINLVINQDQYSHLITTDDGIGLPELRLRRNLYDIKNGRYNNNDYSALMYLMQQRFDKLPTSLFGIRRLASDYKNLSPSNRDNLIKRLRLHMRERGIQSDLFQKLLRINP